MVFIPRPISNGTDTICLPAEWYSSACVVRKLVIGTFTDTGSVAYRMAYDFHGRGKHMAACTYTETYSGPGSATKLCGKTAGIGMHFDVWKAWEDGIWTSSVVIRLYADYSVASTKVVAVAKSFSNDNAWAEEVCTTISIGTPDVTCPTTLVATVTVYDDGTYTIV
jgi:hypothetical protein